MLALLGCLARFSNNLATPINTVISTYQAVFFALSLARFSKQPSKG